MSDFDADLIKKIKEKLTNNKKTRKIFLFLTLRIILSRKIKFLRLKQQPKAETLFRGGL